MSAAIPPLTARAQHRYVVLTATGVKGAVEPNFQQTFAQAARNFPKRNKTPLSISGVVRITG